MTLHLIENSDQSSQSPWQDRDNNECPPVKSVVLSGSTAFRPVSPLATPFHQTPEAEVRTPVTMVSNGRHPVAHVELNDQQVFLLFVKICSLCLCRLNDAQLTRRFKAAVSKCTAENRRGNLEYMPLQQVVEDKIRRVLGETHWNKANSIFREYCSQNRIHLS